MGKGRKIRKSDYHNPLDDLTHEQRDYISYFIDVWCRCAFYDIELNESIQHELHRARNKLKHMICGAEFVRKNYSCKIKKTSDNTKRFIKRSANV